MNSHWAGVGGSYGSQRAVSNPNPNMGRLYASAGPKPKWGPATAQALKRPNQIVYKTPAWLRLMKRIHPIINAGIAIYEFGNAIPIHNILLQMADEPIGEIQRVSKGEMKDMQKRGFEPHDHKPTQDGPGGKIDIFKDQKGNLFFRTENGNHYEPLYENINIILDR